MTAFPFSKKGEIYPGIINKWEWAGSGIKQPRVGRRFSHPIAAAATLMYPCWRTSPREAGHQRVLLLHGCCCPHPAAGRGTHPRRRGGRKPGGALRGRQASSQAVPPQLRPRRYFRGNPSGRPAPRGRLSRGKRARRPWREAPRVGRGFRRTWPRRPPPLRAEGPAPRVAGSAPSTTDSAARARTGLRTQGRAARKGAARGSRRPGCARGPRRAASHLPWEQLRSDPDPPRPGSLASSARARLSGWACPAPAAARPSECRTRPSSVPPAPALAPRGGLAGREAVAAAVRRRPRR